MFEKNCFLDNYYFDKYQDDETSILCLQYYFCDFIVRLAIAPRAELRIIRLCR